MNQITKLTQFAFMFFMTLALSLLSLSISAQTTDTGWLTNPQHPPVQTRFVLTGQQDPQAKTLTGYLDVKLTGDWKTYWRSPGEGGVAPSIDWQNSQNLSKVDWQWPHPQKFELLGIETLGYKGDTLFPMTLHVEDMSRPVTIDAVLTLSSCTTICVLTDYQIQLTFLPSDLTVDEGVMFSYAQAVSNVPQPSPFIDVTQASWDANQSKLQIKLQNSQGWQQPQVLVDGVDEATRDYSFKLEGMHQEGNIVTASYIVDTWLGDVALDEQSLFVTIKDTNLLAEETTQATAEAIVEPLPSTSLTSVFLFALLGGLILNIMPCVLPVLGMKLSSIVAAQGIERRQIRAQFVASSLGILTSFWILAGFILVLKLTGNAIGWGVQFQSPWFLGLMVLVTTLFGANMLGLFEIRLSSGTNTWLASKGDNSLVGHYVQGMFATLLATPCSAPFLGTAVAFALGADVLTLFATFTALALGMALPWLLVAVFPNIALKLPKPGSWMNVVKIVFGIMMLATSVWLLSLMANHVPMLWIALIAVAAFVVMMARVKKVYGEKALAVSGTASLVLIAGGLLLGSVTADQWAIPLPEDLAWQKLSNSAIEDHVNNGRVVFVDVTADWCVTCKANKIGVIWQDPVYSLLRSPNVATLKGDWTHPDSSVTDFLRAHGLYGVPFNIVYGPAAPQGIPLPVILTDDVVLSAVKQASGGTIQ
ncbi:MULTISPECIES: protein-disulfide reductase DsbD family protein [Vibrio]|uniref:protein-disulfide reductase DsbD family protein n=1 Tax=Vibrio TaxID=662 RepID=UPI001CDBC4C9|nr:MULTISPECIES: protein-disulfide reductase DsbD domain-containing protein [Vibrio]MCA2488273.1 thioredoxin family protein [Vibrio alginolyticus]MDW1781156.1 protein-disulfide reductase DsbD family protein [Vibrio sp. Vb2134]MDW2085371.1 protein-disulfide reductase DsbD family protein [Vibrio sp. 2134-1]MDW2123958.1 protein-disulfide reductase DsbD family protein [Vibrio sp. 2033]